MIALSSCGVSLDSDSSSESLLCLLLITGDKGSSSDWVTEVCVRSSVSAAVGLLNRLTTLSICSCEGAWAN